MAGITGPGRHGTWHAVYSQAARILLLALFGLVHITSSSQGERGDYCNEEAFEPRCPDDHVIVMRSAVFGRIGVGKCIQRNYGHVGCQIDVLGTTDRRCSGRRHCSVQVLKRNFDDTPCPNDLANFLRVEYDCLPVLPAHQADCQRNGKLEVTSTDGIIASVVTEETSCGSNESPWVIRAQPGQTVNFTLYDFDLANDIHSTCRVYAILKEPETGKSVTICGGRQRVHQVFAATSHVVEVKIITSQAQRPYFIMQYRVVGCPTLEGPTHGWLKREGMTATMGCHDGRKWELICDGTRWIGERANCSLDPNTHIILGPIAIPFVLSILLIVVITLLCALCIGCIGIIIHKDQERRHNHKIRVANERAKSNATLARDRHIKMQNMDCPPSTSSADTSGASHNYVDDFPSTSAQSPPTPHNMGTVDRQGNYQYRAQPPAPRGTPTDTIRSTRIPVFVEEVPQTARMPMDRRGQPMGSMDRRNYNYRPIPQQQMPDNYRPTQQQPQQGHYRPLQQQPHDNYRPLQHHPQQQHPENSDYFRLQQQPPNRGNYNPNRENREYFELQPELSSFGRRNSDTSEPLYAPLLHDSSTLLSRPLPDVPEGDGQEENAVHVENTQGESVT